MRDISPSPFISLGLSALLVVGAGLASGCTPDAIDDDGADDDGLGRNAPAVGIDIVEVEANQGTAVAIGRDGEWVGAEGRNAFMIRDRDTMIRVQHVVQDGWVPREILGVLHLETADGEVSTKTRQFMVEGDSDPRNLATNFFFSVLAEEAQPGLRYRVELLEVEGAEPPGGLSEGVVTTPAESALIGYEQTPLEMKIVFVPVNYTFWDTPTSVDMTEDDIQLVYDELLQNNPLQTIEMEIHEPIDYDLQINNLGQLLSPMRSLRSQEGAPPNVYYHALVNVNGGGVDGVAGIASLTGNTKNDGGNRVAATVWFKPNPESPPTSSAGTIVHEVGHNQGFQHVFCPQAASPAASPDPNYPHEGGKIGVFGFGIRSFRLYTPSAAHDYMTYCGNAWVSDWTWNKSYERIRILTSWDYEAAAQTTPTGPIMVGTLFADGSEDWWAMEGPLPSADELSGEQRLRYRTLDGRVEELYGEVQTLSDGETVVVTAALPVPLAELDEVERLDWQAQPHSIDLERVTIGGDLRGAFAVHR